jgi:natural product biosynthesis luciferase-like monooxygenase protein
MDLGVFFFSAEDAPVDGDKYRLFLDSVRYADRQGFSAVWTPERHFHAFGGLYPNPSVLGAAAAMVTERLHIRAGSVVLPFQDPLRVAEEWSVVDNLSRGRVGIACASVWNVNDFVLAPASFERRRDLVAERIEIIRRLWRGEAVRLPNGAGQPVEVRIYPRPVQPTLPVWLAAHGDATFIKAGEIGAHVLTALIYTHPDDLARGIALYRKARARHGFDPAAGTVTLMLHTFVGRTMTQVEEHVMPAYEQYLRVNLGLKDERVLGGDQARRSDEDSRFIIARATEELFRTRGLVGTPDVCVERLAAFRRMGVDEVACLIDFGIPAAEVLDGLERLDGVRRAAASIGVTRPQPVGSVGG